jgi:hypothetical protein
MAMTPVEKKKNFQHCPEMVHHEHISEFIP